LYIGSNFVEHWTLGFHYSRYHLSFGEVFVLLPPPPASVVNSNWILTQRRSKRDTFLQCQHSALSCVLRRLLAALGARGEFIYPKILSLLQLETLTREGLLVFTWDPNETHTN